MTTEPSERSERWERLKFGTFWNVDEGYLNVVCGMSKEQRDIALFPFYPRFPSIGLSKAIVPSIQLNRPII